MPGSEYRLPGPPELESLQTFIRDRSEIREDGTSEMEVGRGALRPVAEGRCVQGFFDVLNNAPEWSVTHQDLQQYLVRRDAGKAVLKRPGELGLRLVLDLRRAHEEKPEPRLNPQDLVENEGAEGGTGDP